MSYAEAPENVAVAICDGPGCGIQQLFERGDEADVPTAWCRLGIGLGYRVFCSIGCANAWQRALSIEVRTRAGWEIHYTIDTLGPQA